MGATIGGETLLHATVSLDFPLQFHFIFVLLFFFSFCGKLIEYVRMIATSPSNPVENSCDCFHSHTVELDAVNF